MDTYDHFKSPAKLPLQKEIPDVFTFLDGRRVKDAADWEARKKEIKSLYEYYMYGPLPEEKDTVSYRLTNWREVDEEVKFFDGTAMQAKARACDIEVLVECKGRTDRVSGIVTLPKEAPKHGAYPVYLEMVFVFGGGEMKPSYNAYYAASRGYAAISWEPTRVAADNGSRSGAFYTVHPYGSGWKQQTGALAAWGWGASKLLDALAGGAAKELSIDWENNILSGVSRFGKSVLVAGAYDSRIRVVVPACSGAGGAAMYRCDTEGNIYDLAELGFADEEGKTLHLTTKNEPLESLQSTDERHWFNDRFLEFDSVERFPFDQHHLAALIADPKRYLFLIAAATNEDWTNPAAMCETYLRTRAVYDFLEIPDQLAIDIHLQGHAVLPADMAKLLDYCDVMLYGEDRKNVQTDLGTLKRDGYFKLAGKDA